MQFHNVREASCMLCYLSIDVGKSKLSRGDRVVIEEIQSITNE